ncbi:MAG TPA: IS1 family transposase [Chloroflexi bacterium]|nr:IS1 family transposase [Chloroflexota bacterium]
MDPQTVFCPNPACPARGQIGKGNIGIHSRKERRYICRVCGKTFAETKGTVFYRLRTAKDLVVIVVTLLAYGCPVQAIVMAFGLDERTVVEWQKRAGEHCQRVHEHLVEQPRDLGQVQADEIRVKTQGGVLWMAMALQVSARLWLGGVLSAHRDGRLIKRLVQKVRAAALCRPLLFCVDGFSAYVEAIRAVFREPIRTGRPGRPRLRPWDGICIAQVVKRYARKRVVGVIRRILQGSSQQVQALLERTQGGGQINVAYIERLNATFRSRIAALVRRGRALVRQVDTLHQAMYLMGTVYNFCTYHKSLRVPIYLPGNRRRWVQRTPAIAAGITDHRWTVEELLSFRVPLPPWRPPKRRGRPSKHVRALVAQWST